MENVVFYFSDQQRYDTAVKEVMPNLIDFAEDGTFLIIVIRVSLSADRRAPVCKRDFIRPSAAVI